MARISGTESSAATKWISDVPGFVKHVVTPAWTSVRISASAPLGMRPKDFTNPSPPALRGEQLSCAPRGARA